MNPNEMDYQALPPQNYDNDYMMMHPPTMMPMYENQQFAGGHLPMDVVIGRHLPMHINASVPMGPHFGPSYDNYGNYNPHAYGPVNGPSNGPVNGPLNGPMNIPLNAPLNGPTYPPYNPPTPQEPPQPPNTPINSLAPQPLNPHE